MEPRIIKFRAWLENEKKMIEVARLVWAALTGNFMVCTEDTEYYIASLDVGHPPDCYLMQFTGLKAHDGVEIFEGDLLKYSPGVLEEGGDTDAVFLVKHGDYIHDEHLEMYGWYLETAEEQDGKIEIVQQDFGHDWVTLLMVAGNMFENPLLIPRAD